MLTTSLITACALATGKILARRLFKKRVPRPTVWRVLPSEAPAVPVEHLQRAFVDDGLVVTRTDDGLEIRERQHLVLRMVAATSSPWRAHDLVITSLDDSAMSTMRHVLAAAYGAVELAPATAPSPCR
jgi:hypothetical protein|nr:hypothetical protein [Kofleriaceae bacterium]